MFSTFLRWLVTFVVAAMSSPRGCTLLRASTASPEELARKQDSADGGDAGIDLGSAACRLDILWDAAIRSGHRPIYILSLRIRQCLCRRCQYPGAGTTTPTASYSHPKANPASIDTFVDISINQFPIATGKDGSVFVAKSTASGCRGITTARSRLFSALGRGEGLTVDDNSMPWVILGSSPRASLRGRWQD